MAKGGKKYVANKKLGIARAGNCFSLFVKDAAKRAAKPGMRLRGKSVVNTSWKDLSERW